jgi:hypothetical protein
MCFLLELEEQEESTFLMRGLRDLRSCLTNVTGRRDGIGRVCTDDLGGGVAK